MKKVVVKKIVCTILIILSIISIVICYSFNINNSADFAENCTAHIEKAATASSVEIAKEELALAIEYVEKNIYKEGNDAYEDENVEYWYNNMKAAYEKLENVPADASEEAKSTVLLQINESLLKHTVLGKEVELPNNIKDYLSIVNYNVLCVISLIVLASCVVILLIKPTK